MPEVLTFATVALRKPPDFLVWKPAGITAVTPQLYIFAHFKRYYLKLWLLISLKLGAK